MAPAPRARPPPAARVRAALVAALLVAAAVRAQVETGGAQPPLEHVRATAVVTRLPPGVEPVLDGDLSDPAWRLVPPLSGLRTRVPVENGEPSQRTEFRVAQDGRALWLALACWDDAPDEIRATQRRRDADLFPDDRVEIVLDTQHDKNNGYFFEIGAGGALKDALMSRDGDDINKDWDGIWDGRAQVTAEGWFAEVRIPLRTLDVSADVTTWGFNIMRFLRRTREEIVWSSPWQDSSLYRIRDAGELSGFTDLQLGLGIDWVPYVKLGSHDVDAEDDTDLLGTAGGELFWQVTPGVTGTLTVNTDFAETEVDERVVNLTRFPVFFPEKRKFFLQDAGVFTFDTGSEDKGALLLPFFSRRIGLDADGNPIPIDAGAKLSGLEGPWSLGVLAVRMGAAGGNDARDLLVARVRRTLGDNATVGALVTSGSPTGTEDNRVVGADWRWTESDFLGDRNLDLTAFGLRSQTEGPTGDDNAFGAEVSYPNDLWQWRARARQIGERFDPALGFVSRTGIREADGGLAFSPRPGGNVRQWSLFWVPDLVQDLDGHLATRTQTGGASIEMESGDEADVHLTSTFDRIDEDFEILPGITVPADRYEYTRKTVSFETAGKRPVVLAVDHEWGPFEGGDLSQTTTTLDWRPGGAFQIGGDYETEALDLPGGEFTVRLVDVRAEVNWSPRLSWQNLVQYDNVSRQLGWNSRLRWTLQPGDDVYLVLNQGWDRTTPTGSEHEPLVPAQTDFTLKIVRTFAF